MIVETGLFALILALFISAIQAVVPLIGASRNEPAWMNVDRPAAAVLFALVTLSFGALMWAHVTSDFSVLNVVQNSHTDKPLLYKITGVWGSHEGSMMLWTFILTLYGMAVAVFGGNLPPGLRARVLSVQAMIAFGFILFILLTSNPFTRVYPPPLNGEGLNPLLQDPGLAFHPPFLYLGYVGFSMAFSFAIAALIEGRVDAAWARWVRPWTLVAWCALTLGVAMGSWWSYYTLGWGGYWAWDPVENASLMPWLAGTALLHSAIVAEKRDTLKAWTIFLAIITFSLSLLGTFLVRSGVLTSVHSFAVDPQRGVFILLLLLLFTGASLFLFALRAPALKSGGLFAPISRESGLLFNNLLLSIAAATVLLGTLYPLFVDALGLGKISVGPPYFDSVFVPLMAPMILVMAIGPFLSWRRGNLKDALARLKLAFVVTVVTIAATLMIAGTSSRTLWASLGFGLAAWLFFGSLIEWTGRIGLFRRSLTEAVHRARHLPRSAYGMTIAHMGLAIVLAGITGSLAWKTEMLQVMRPGDSVMVSGYQLTFTGVDNDVKGPNYTASRATFVASKDGQFVAKMQPERRVYANPPQDKSTVAIHTNFVDDLYAVFGEPDGKGGFVTHFFLNPLVPWIFFGAVVMVFGGIVSLSDRRHRVGAPIRKARASPHDSSAEMAHLKTTAVKRMENKILLRGWVYLVPLLAFIVMAGFFIHRLQLVSEGDAPNFIPSAMINKPAPAFNLPPLLVDRPGLKTADLKGKVTLVDFFASWCVPCRQEHPVLRLVTQAGIRLVGINYKDKPADAKAWLAELGDPYQAVAVDAHGQTGINFGVYGVPESYLVDKNGVIRFKQTGPLTPEVLREKLIPMVEKLKQ
ncbi:MAG: heme lyase CcmF/NrfE family subunit [Alphaproteobacteria bacterium]|nr:heme lyase CcmF/NrfE family subunit [Alphaproteobacteria bacterium]